MTKMAKISLNRYPIYDRNGSKTIPFGTAHTYTAHLREYPLPLPRKCRLYRCILMDGAFHYIHNFGLNFQTEWNSIFHNFQTMVCPNFVEFLPVDFRSILCCRQIFFRIS